MSVLGDNIDNVTKLCKALGSENRIGMFLKLLDEKKPVDIAKELKISRAGLQKHIESLLETGLLVKKGSGRNTKYLPTDVSLLVLRNLKSLGALLEMQREVLKLEDTLLAVENVPNNVSDGTKTEFVRSLKEELEKRSQKLNGTTETLLSCLERTETA